MATPNKFSPYSTPLQYPSQSADYISLESGGSNRNNFKIQHFSSQERNSPYQQYNKNYRRQFSNNQGDFRENKKKHFNNSRKNSEYDFSLYFHPSMLQDPWQNLVKRYDSLCASKISHKEKD